MKRQKMTAVSILLFLEKQKSEATPLSSISAELAEGDAAKAASINYHVLLMSEHGLVQLSGSSVRPTWQGHDYLDMNRPPPPAKIRPDVMINPVLK